jgi:FtsH-binding integral membrane protein
VNRKRNHKCAFGLASGVIIALGATGAALDLEMPQLHSLLIFFLVNIYIYIYIYIFIFKLFFYLVIGFPMVVVQCCDFWGLTDERVL